MCLNYSWPRHQYQLYLPLKEDLKQRLIEWAEEAHQGELGIKDNEP
jgi:hypothetical protein